MKSLIINILSKLNIFEVLFESYQEKRRVLDVRKKSPLAKIHINNNFLLDNLTQIEIGENVNIGSNNVFCVMNGLSNKHPQNTKLIVGSNTYIGEYNNIRATLCNIEIGANCLISQQVSIFSSDHGMKKESLIRLQDWTSRGDVIIEDDVWIGASSQILSGVKIGEGAIVAAGSTVIKDIEPYSIVAGSPAIHKKYRE